ncbi:CLUMA_CG016173, isoform A [Clunio marinus]|uniref:CLUMA_CG016173, isoform A n=1 Tax=Clunio marinus TaxID=568069 RepID=A0A1J1ISR9_9DIPT|nr:CLUMA_CG016173, isoform A [Clunio marinus]
MTTLSTSWILLAAMFLVSTFLIMASATGNEIYENRGLKSDEINGDKDKKQFFMGSRYGRSQSDLTSMDENGKTSNMARIVPRNDRFFFGSRYGKRSAPISAMNEDNNQFLSCFYTGLTNLFRCIEKMELQFNVDEVK